jgi:hypothetical protein
MSNEKIAKILVVLGGIVALIEAILSFAGTAVLNFFPIVGPIIALILALLVLLMVFKGIPMDWDNAIVMLILGILIIIFGSLIGGILVILGAILLFLD